MEKLIKDLNELLEKKGCTDIKILEVNHPEIGLYCTEWDFRASYKYDTPKDKITDRVVSIYALGAKIALVIYDYKGNEWVTTSENAYYWHEPFVSILEKKLIDSWPDTDYRPQH